MNPDLYAQHLRKMQADRLSRSRITTTSSTANDTLNLPPPPAYTPSATLQPPAAHAIPHISSSTPAPASYYDDEEEEEDDEEFEHRVPWATNVTVTAPVKVVGHGNILNTSSLMSMLSSTIAAALQQHQQQQQQQQPQPQPQPSQQRQQQPLAQHSQSAEVEIEDMPKDIKRSPENILRPLNLNLNCGISIIGSRNIVGESLAKAAVIARATHAASCSGTTSSSSSSTTVQGESSSSSSKPAKRKHEIDLEEGAPPAKKMRD